MAYCGPKGIAWEDFLAWSKVSRDAAILWQIRQNRICPSCGTHPDDWDPAHGGHPRAYVATVGVCGGCAALENRRPRFEKDREKDRLAPGSHLVLRRQDTGGL